MSSPTSPTPSNPKASFWSALGLTYEHAFSTDPFLISMVKKWLSYLPPSSLILECGCGTGVPIALTIGNTDAGHKYHGIDIAEGMVEICGGRIPGGEFEVVSMLDYVPDLGGEEGVGGGGRFDGIVGSLSHFEMAPAEHVVMAEKWFEWLRFGGCFLLCTIAASTQDLQNEPTYSPTLECASDIEAIFLGTKIRVTSFTQEGWRKLLKGPGFEIVWEDTDVFEPKWEKREEAPLEARFYVMARKPLQD